MSDPKGQLDPEASPPQTSALILGVTGQDGYYLSKYLLSLGYKVYGMVRDLESRLDNVAEALPNVSLLPGDMTDKESIVQCLEAAHPDEIYNLAGLSSVGQSFESPELAMDTNCVGVVRLLEAVRLVGQTDIRLFQASSSEMYGDSSTGMQDESTALRPVSPYGVAKAAAHHLCRVYRDSYSLFISCGILFNHESVRRPDWFVTKKVATGAARIKLGLQAQLTLGNLDVRRDWGFAGDYVVAMHRMLQVSAPDDFVIATGVDRSLRDFVRVAFESADIPDWRDRVVTDEKFFRAADITRTVGNSEKAKKVLGWAPSTDFRDLIGRMVDYEVRRLMGDNSIPLGESSLVHPQRRDPKSRQ